MLYICVYLFAYLVSTFYVSYNRLTIFNEDFIDKHKGKFTDRSHEIQLGASPDTGNGPIADELSYRDWFQFNKVQRLHLNFFETCTIVCAMAAIASIQFPVVVFIVFPIYILGRITMSFAVCYNFNMKCMFAIVGLLLLAPLYTIFGFGVGTILQRVSYKAAIKNSDPVQTQKWFPWKLEVNN